MAQKQLSSRFIVQFVTFNTKAPSGQQLEARCSLATRSRSFPGILSLFLRNMSRRGFKTYRKDAAQAHTASIGQIFQLDQAKYHEGITASGSSLTFASALPLPPQPLLVRQPLPPVTPIISMPIPEVPRDPPLKQKTQVCWRFTGGTGSLMNFHRLRKPSRNL